MSFHLIVFTDEEEINKSVANLRGRPYGPIFSISCGFFFAKIWHNHTTTGCVEKRRGEKTLPSANILF